jgi:hypothetical protein
MNEAASAGLPRQRAAAAPVWFVWRNGRLLVQTDAASGKVKRIRRNPQVRVAVCTASGRLRMIIFRPLRFVQARLHLGRPRTEPAILSITPS